MESEGQVLSGDSLYYDREAGMGRAFDNVQIYFLNMFEQVIRNASKDKQSISKLRIRAFFASLAGIVMTSKSLPGHSEDEKRAYMHKLALLIIRDNRSLEL